MIIIRLSVGGGTPLCRWPGADLNTQGEKLEGEVMAKIERYEGKYLVAQIEDWLSDVRSSHADFAFEMSNSSPRTQAEFWLLAQAFMLEMAKYHDPELGPTKNNRVAVECALLKKLADDAFSKPDKN